MANPRPDWRSDWQDHLFDQMLNGRTVVDICKEDDMPSRSAILRAEGRDPNFSEAYTRARMAQGQYFGDKIIEIVHRIENGEYKNEDYSVLKLLLDSSKWLAAKFYPKVYGDKVQVDAVISTETLSPDQQIEKIQGLIPQISPILIELGWTPPTKQIEAND